MSDAQTDKPKIIEKFPGGTVTPPASKSLCHRAVICAALASGDRGSSSVLMNIDRSDDVDATVAGMSALCEDPARPAVIDCNESGSTLRFLLPIAALREHETVFLGRGRLLQRPLDIYADIFAKSGVAFVHDEREARVRGPFRAGVYTLSGDVSSQFVSGLLFALPLVDGDSEIRLATPLQSRQYVDLTVDVMSRFGVDIKEFEEGYRVRGNQKYRAADYTVEADYSQAAFFLAAAALGQTVRVAGLNRDSRQGDRAILKILRDMGAEVNWRGAEVSVTAGKLKAVTVDARDVPDLVPPVAALCCFCDGTSRIVNAGRVRLKESDRLHALAVELSKLGAQITEHDDGLSITGARYLTGGGVDAWGDHRIAMAMAVASIRCREPVAVSGWRCVSKSYPGFWRDFEVGEKEKEL